MKHNHPPRPGCGLIDSPKCDIDADTGHWVAHLDQLHIAHSGVKEPDYATTAMVTFRDPDNIQLEFFWPGR